MILIPTGWNPEDKIQLFFKFIFFHNFLNTHHTFYQDFELALEPKNLGSNGGLIFFFSVLVSLKTKDVNSEKE